MGIGEVDNVGYINAMLAGGIEENCKHDGIPPIAMLELYTPDHTGPDYVDEIRTSIKWMEENLPGVKMR